jgi:hypothetical protein
MMSALNITAQIVDMFSCGDVKAAVSLQDPTNA